MATFEAVPQCDFAHLRQALHRVFVDGHAYNAYDRRDRAAAYAQRYKMVVAISESQWTERFNSSENPDVVFGANWVVPVFFVYSHRLDTLWVYMYSEIVVQHAVDRTTGDKVQALQRARKLLVTRELEAYDFTEHFFRTPGTQT